MDLVKDMSMFSPERLRELLEELEEEYARAAGGNSSARRGAHLLRAGLPVLLPMQRKEDDVGVINFISPEAMEQLRAEYGEELRITSAEDLAKSPLMLSILEQHHWSALVIWMDPGELAELLGDGLPPILKEEAPIGAVRVGVFEPDAAHAFVLRLSAEVGLGHKGAQA